MHRGVLAVAVAAGLVGLFPGVASARSSLEMRTSGSLVLTWEGDASRGCAAAGLCGDRGSLTLPVGGQGSEVESGSSPAVGLLDLSSIDTQSAAVVRSIDRTSEGTAACVDLVPVGFLELSVSPVRGPLYRVTLGGPDLPLGLSSGRCAGPLASDLAGGGLPSALLDVRRLARSRVTLDLSGRFPVEAGPFSGELTSTVRIALRALSPRPVRRRSMRADHRARRRAREPERRTVRRRLAQVTLTYRVAPAAGRFDASFTGDPANCRVFDSCGAIGTSTYAFPTRGGSLDLEFETFISGGRRPSLTSLLRRADGDGDGELVPGAAVVASERLTRGSGTCTDTRRADVPTLLAHLRRARLSLTLGGPQFEFGDQLRTHCAGPTQADALGRGAFAHVSLPRRALTRRRLRAVLRGRHVFSGNGYSGSAYGGVVLDMHRVHARVRTLTVTVPRGVSLP